MTTTPTLTEHHRQRLVMALGLVDLDDADRRLLDWLAGWDQPTVDGLVRLFAKLTNGPVSAAPQCEAGGCAADASVRLIASIDPGRRRWSTSTCDEHRARAAAAVRALGLAIVDVEALR